MAYDLSEDEDEDVVDDDDDGADDEGPKKSKKKLIVIAVAVLALLLVGGGVAVFLVGGKSDHAGEAPAMVAEGEAYTPYFYELPEMLVDLKSKRSRTPFIKIRVMIELTSQEYRERVIQVEPKIIDGIQSFLREQTKEDLLGQAGTERMRTVFLDVVNRAINPVQAQNILFRDILMQ